jgi:hypothetical protein
MLSQRATLFRRFTSISSSNAKRFFVLRYTLDARKLSELESKKTEIQEEFQSRTDDFENKRHILYGGKLKDAEGDSFVFLFESENETLPYDFIKEVR